jgi:hypothetical protein
MATNAQANAHLIAAAPDLYRELSRMVESCPLCAGSGFIYTMADETEIGQTPGRSTQPCPDCKDAAAALSKARGGQS